MTTIMKCKNCGTEIQAQSAFCTECGAKIDIQTTDYCKKCGADMDAGDLYCKNCGTARNASKRGKTTALIVLVVILIFALAVVASIFAGQFVYKEYTQTDSEWIETRETISPANSEKPEEEAEEEPEVQEEEEEKGNIKTHEHTEKPTEEPTEEPEEDSEEEENASAITTGGFIFDSHTKYITEADLRGKTKEQVAMMRNEIFARHGYEFQSEPYKSYFESKSWYKPNPGFSESSFNAYENANKSYIIEYEKSMGWR